MDKKYELYARKEGARYFDEDFYSLDDWNKYKHEMVLNTALWWFRAHKKRILIFTSNIASTDYLFDVIKAGTTAKIYYANIPETINLEMLKDYYKDSEISFTRIDFIPENKVPYFTKKGRRIPYSTLVLASDDTIIFDKKELGLRWDVNGDRGVYRIKDKEIFKELFDKFNMYI